MTIVATRHAVWAVFAWSPQPTHRIGAIVLAAAAGACTPVQSTLRPPYEIAGVQYSEAELQAMATDRCRRSQSPAESLPPHPFTTDGCSLSPNGRWTECCVEHDMAYWCDGAASLRRAADQLLEACVEHDGRPVLAKLMYVGVRVGGSGWLPFPWRWGYGYPWMHTAVASKDAKPSSSPKAPDHPASEPGH
jgi:hypothetical protein